MALFCFASIPCGVLRLLMAAFVELHLMGHTSCKVEVIGGDICNDV